MLLILVAENEIRTRLSPKHAFVFKQNNQNIQTQIQHATSLQKPPMGQHNSGCCREVTAMERLNVQLSCTQELLKAGCYWEMAVVER